MKIGDKVFVSGVVDEIRKDVVIIKNSGGYFGTVEDEISPQRQIGHWIYHSDWEIDGECGYECSECGRCADYAMNYCGHCGCVMEVEHERHDIPR